MYDVLTDDNILMFAILNYSNPQCMGINEFLEDYKKVAYIKKLFTQYDNGKEIKERLILNHFISLYNVFNYKELTKILFFRILPKHHSYLKTFLVYLNHIEDNADGIMVNPIIVEKLRKL